MLEDTNQLEPRISALEEDIEDVESSEEEEIIVSNCFICYLNITYAYRIMFSSNHQS